MEKKYISINLNNEDRLYMYNENIFTDVKIYDLDIEVSKTLRKVLDKKNQKNKN